MSINQIVSHEPFVIRSKSDDEMDGKIYRDNESRSRLRFSEWTKSKTTVNSKE